MIRAYLKSLAYGFSMLGLAACVSVLPEPEAPDALYRIDAPSTRQTLNTNIVIREPDAPQIVAGQAMASEDSSGAFRLIPSVEWTGRSTRLLQLALVDSFTIDGDGAALMPETGVEASYALSSRLQAFELRGDDAVCNVSLVLHATRRSDQYFKQAEVSVRRRVEGKSTANRAIAMKAAAEQCVVEMSEFVAETLQAKADS